MNRNELIVEMLDNLNKQFPDQGWSRADVKNCVVAFESVVSNSLGKGEPVNLSGFLKLYSRSTPAKPARDGVNPFTKEPMRFAAKPASVTVKATALKNLKDSVAAASKKTARKKK